MRGNVVSFFGEGFTCLLMVSGRDGGGGGSAQGTAGSLLSGLKRRLQTEPISVCRRTWSASEHDRAPLRFKCDEFQRGKRAERSVSLPETTPKPASLKQAGLEEISVLTLSNTERISVFICVYWTLWRPSLSWQTSKWSRSSSDIKSAIVFLPLSSSVMVWLHLSWIMHLGGLCTCLSTEYQFLPSPSDARKSFYNTKNIKCIAKASNITGMHSFKVAMSQPPVLRSYPIFRSSEQGGLSYKDCV